MQKMQIAKWVNTALYWVESALNWALTRIWFPGIVHPPKNSVVEFTGRDETQKGYVFSGRYDGKYVDYPMKLEKAGFWRLKNGINLPKLPEYSTEGRFSGITTHIVGGTEASNWLTMQKHLKKRQEDPLYTSLPEKKQKVQEFKDQKKEREQLIRQELSGKTREKFNEYFG